MSIDRVCPGHSAMRQVINTIAGLKPSPQRRIGLLPSGRDRGYVGKMRSRDTTDEAHAVQLEAYRKMGPARRVLLAFEMSERAREIAIAGVLAREPELGPDGARAKVMRTILGDALYDAAYAIRGRT